SLLFTQVHTNSYAVLDHSVVLPNVVINRSARLRKCVIDRGVEIPTGLVVGEDPADDAKFFRVSEKGTTLITKEMIAKWEAAQ
ncbi:MAG: glucose-1-phosphate adenylyltransferase, partial [Pseudomonadota bacterium]